MDPFPAIRDYNWPMANNKQLDVKREGRLSKARDF